MAHNRSYKPEDIRFPDQHIVQSDMVDEMEKSYIEYAADRRNGKTGKENRSWNHFV